MTRTQFFQRIAATFTALPLFARRKDDVWSTPQGQYVLGLRAELERLGHFDDLKEDWQEVEEALREGCLYFLVTGSRMTEDKSKMLYRVLPARMGLLNHILTGKVQTETEYVDIVGWRVGR